MNPIDPERRRFLQRTSAALTLLTGTAAASPKQSTVAPAVGAGQPLGYRPTHTPNGATLPFRTVAGAKVFHLVVEEVEHSFAPGLAARCYGYNGRVHGPTIEAVEGDLVRIYVTNRLDVPTTVHWHGLLVPNGMDGVGGLSQRAIESGETFRYEFTLRQHGTFLYHSHHDEMTQMAMGLMGMFIVHPREREALPPDHDFVYLLSEWKIAPGTRRPDPLEMTDFNVLTLNACVFPHTESLRVHTGERVRIRIGNLSAMDHHPIHLHGHVFQVVGTDGGSVPESARIPETSVLVPVGSSRTIEFVAGDVGDWALHCHMTHHVMTQMGHGLANTIGVDPAAFDEALIDLVPEYESMGEDGDGVIPDNTLPMTGGRGPHGFITMGGMFTILKVRPPQADLSIDDWAGIDPARQARPAEPDELRSDGVRED